MCEDLRLLFWDCLEIIPEAAGWLDEDCNTKELIGYLRNIIWDVANTHIFKLFINKSYFCNSEITSKSKGE